MSYQNDALFRFLRGEESGGLDCTGQSQNATSKQDECGGWMGKSLAMVYSPEQDFQNLYDSEEGLCRGTIFCELEKPFHGAGRGK